MELELLKASLDQGAPPSGNKVERLRAFVRFFLFFSLMFPSKIFTLYSLGQDATVIHNDLA
jgi:hypothetical protein